jgi:probable rRNA maturation factor
MTAPALEIDVVIESGEWPSDAEAVVHEAVTQASRTQTRGRAVVVLLTNDAAVQRLNATWRGFDKPTNVLSFPAPEGDPSGMLGDIAIAYETTAREAGEENKPLAHHLAHLVVHGFLHLIGHDHDNDHEADAMEQLEREILAKLGVPDPYLTREHAGA